MPTSVSIVRKFFPDVTHVKDARRDLRLAVMNRDVSLAKTKKHQACAIARACRRTQKLDGVIVSIGTVYLVKGEASIRHTVPQSVSREIAAFDRGARFAPGNYIQKRPPKIKPRGSGTRHKGDPRAGNKPPRHYTRDIRLALNMLGGHR